MAKKKDNNFNVTIAPENVMYTSINTSKDGYNSARMVVKSGDNEYMSISYEWEGSGIPGFAMDLMGFMKQNNIEKSGIWEGKDKAYDEFAAKKGANPFTKKKDEKDMEDEEEDPKKKKTDKKEDKKKK